MGDSFVLPVEQTRVTRQQAKVQQIIEETDAKAQQILANAENKSQVVIQTANNEAERIIEEARKKAQKEYDTIKNQAYEEGFKKGGIVYKKEGGWLSGYATANLLISLTKSLLSPWHWTVSILASPRLMIPRIDLASTIAEPQQTSTSKSHFSAAFTNSLTSAVSFNLILIWLICATSFL